MVVSEEAVKAICERHQIGQSYDDPDLLHSSVTLVESLTVDVDALLKHFNRMMLTRSQRFPNCLKKACGKDREQIQKLE